MAENEENSTENEQSTIHYWRDLYDRDNLEPLIHKNLGRLTRTLTNQSVNSLYEKLSESSRNRIINSNTTSLTDDKKKQLFSKVMGEKTQADRILIEYEECISKKLIDVETGLDAYKYIKSWRGTELHREWDFILLGLRKNDTDIPPESLKGASDKLSTSELADEARREYREQAKRQNKTDAELLINAITGNNSGFDIISLKAISYIALALVGLWVFGGVVSCTFGSV